MASSSPPSLPPPSPSLDDLMVVPPTLVIPDPVERCGRIIEDDTSLDIFPPIDASLPLGCTLGYVPPSPTLPPFPATVIQPPPQLGSFYSYKPYYDNARGRNRNRSRGSSRSRSPSPATRSRSATPERYVPMPPTVPTPIVVYPPTEYRSYSPDSFRSPSPRPTRRRRYSYRSRTPSPIQPYMFPPPPPPAPPICVPIMSPPSPAPPPFAWPQMAEALYPDPDSDPVDILTFKYNKNMAYSPASKTYDEAIDNVLELWPDLREFGRDRVHLFVGGPDQMVRIPKMAWELIMRDFRRYEIVHIQVDQPPQYQGDGKGNWDDKKNKKKGGFFSSIKRIFRR